MNISHEFFKIKDSFRKVKDDMNFLSNRITENYDEFTRRHKVLAQDIENITLELKSNLDKIKQATSNTQQNKISDKDLLDLKSEIRTLKLQVHSIQNTHNNIADSISDIRENKKQIKSLKEKLSSGELEIYLLKERLVEKDAELKQIKEVSRNLFNIVDDLSKTELDMLNMAHVNKK